MIYSNLNGDLNPSEGGGGGTGVIYTFHLWCYHNCCLVGTIWNQLFIFYFFFKWESNETVIQHKKLAETVKVTLHYGRKQHPNHVQISASILFGRHYFVERRGSNKN